MEPAEYEATFGGSEAATKYVIEGIEVPAPWGRTDDLAELVVEAFEAIEVPSISNTGFGMELLACQTVRLAVQRPRAR